MYCVLITNIEIHPNKEYHSRWREDENRLFVFHVITFFSHVLLDRDSVVGGDECSMMMHTRESLVAGASRR